MSLLQSLQDSPLALFIEKTFVVLGFDKQKQDDLEMVISQLGGRIADSVSSDTGYLVTTPDVAKLGPHSHLMKEAIEFGVPVVSESFIWQAMVVKNPKMLDTSKFRLYKSELSTPSSEKSNEFEEYFEAPKISTALKEEADFDVLDDQLKHSETLLEPSKPTFALNLGNNASKELRLEWQKLLMTYLTGDDLESQKLKMASNDEMEVYRRRVYLEIIGKLYLQPVNTLDQWMFTLRKDMVPPSLQMLKEFRVSNDPESEVKQVLDGIDICESMFSSLYSLETEFPEYLALQPKLDTLRSWYNTRYLLKELAGIVSKWIGQDFCNAELNLNAFMEQKLKEDGVAKLFDNHLMRCMDHILSKSIDTVVENHEKFSQLGLPLFVDCIVRLGLFPVKLVETCVLIWTGNSFHLKNDSTIILDDFKVLLDAVARMKKRSNELKQKIEKLNDPLGLDAFCFNDATSHRAFDFYLEQLEFKFIKSKKSTRFNVFRNVELLESEYEKLNSLLDMIKMDELRMKTLKTFAKLTENLFHFIVSNYQQGLTANSDQETREQLQRFFTRLVYNIRVNSRKILQFSKVIISDLEALLKVYPEPKPIELTQNIQHVQKSIMKTCIHLLRGVKLVRTKNLSVDLVEDYFTFVSSFSRQALSSLSHLLKILLCKQLIRLALEWISFTCSDCLPTDPRTIRWAVLALDFTLWVTKGENILVLSDETFLEVKRKVACCMTLIIGGFSSQNEDKPSVEFKTKSQVDANDPFTRAQKRLELLEQLDKNREQLLQSRKHVGKLLDHAEPANKKLLELLRSSSSTVQMRWQQGKFLGGGSFGSVHIGINLDSGDLLAVKEIKFSGVSMEWRIQEEMRVLEVVKHPNVVSYFGIEVHRDKCFIFMEYCSGGSLRNLLDNGGRIEDELVVQLFSYELLDAIEYLHQKKIAHRDIKSDNILIDANGLVKLVDFGAAKLFEIPEPGNRKLSLIGTPNYMAPEVVTGQPDTILGSQDIWAYGCVVLEMISGKRPWSHLDNDWAVMYQIGISNQHPPLPPCKDDNNPPSIEIENGTAKMSLNENNVVTISKECLTFLKQCFLTVKERPRAAELKKNAYFSTLLAKLVEFRLQNSATYPNPLGFSGFFTNGLNSPGFIVNTSTAANSVATNSMFTATMNTREGYFFSGSSGS